MVYRNWCLVCSSVRHFKVAWDGVLHMIHRELKLLQETPTFIGSERERQEYKKKRRQIAVGMGGVANYLFCCATTYRSVFNFSELVPAKGISFIRDTGTFIFAMNAECRPRSEHCCRPVMGCAG